MDRVIFPAGQKGGLVVTAFVVASFAGTPDEFHRFLGPRIRNSIQSKTKRAKRLLAACEECGKSGELESAHRHGRERKAVIEQVLAAHHRKGRVVVEDLAALEKAILAAHEPYNEYFRFLCRACHVTYDAKV